MQSQLYHLLLALSVPALLLFGCQVDVEDPPHGTGPGDDDSADDDTAGDDDVSDDDSTTLEEDCTSAELPWVRLWSFDFPSDGVARAGTFATWNIETVQFETATLGTFEFWVEGDESLLATLPDLSAAGKVEVVQVGSYSDDSGGAHGAVIVHAVGDPSDVLLMTGQHWEGQGEFAGWTVDSGQMDTATCGAYPVEHECCDTVYNRPVAFTFANEAFTLFQGQERTVGDLTVRVSEAWGHGGPQTCPDYFCPRLRYMAYRPSL